MDKFKVFAKKFWAFDIFIDVKGLKVPVVKTLVFAVIVGGILF
jgi:hypothetical protein